MKKTFSILMICLIALGNLSCSNEESIDETLLGLESIVRTTTPIMRVATCGLGGVRGERVNRARMASFWPMSGDRAASLDFGRAVLAPE